jgi:hypothetical protein
MRLSVLKPYSRSIRNLNMGNASAKSPSAGADLTSVHLAPGNTWPLTHARSIDRSAFSLSGCAEEGRGGDQGGGDRIVPRRGLDRRQSEVRVRRLF